MMNTGSKSKYCSERGEMNKKKLNYVALNSLVIEKIIDHRTNKKQIQYQIKWKICKLKTWLTIEFISPAIVLLRYYSKIVSEIQDKYPSLPLIQKAELLFTLLGEATEQEIKNILKQYLTISGLKLPCSKRDIIIQRLQRLIKYRVVPSIHEIKNLRAKVIEEKVIELKKNQLDILKKLEFVINLISDNNKIITIENNVDLEILPCDFIYVNNYIPGKNIKIPNDSPIGCECSTHDGCASFKKNLRSECCSVFFNTQPAYDKCKRLKLKKIQPIYECNLKCLCDRSCPNRVVQNGSNVKLEIFRTFNNCGWGVRAREKIIKGTFVGKYVGEVITYGEAEKLNQDYLFDIDFDYAKATDFCPYTVDATKYGNISRFINHSCNPNLLVLGVLIDCLDPDFHEIAFFASRNIESGEELSFNYRKIMTCNCGAINCRLK